MRRGFSIVGGGGGWGIRGCGGLLPIENGLAFGNLEGRVLGY